jgi:hypothetical protein
MKSKRVLSDYTFDIGSMLNPVSNKFCQLYFSGYPLRGLNDFLLYFQAIPGQNNLTAIGIYTGTHDNGLKRYGIIAFSQMSFVKTIFPDIDKTITIGENTGVPLYCSNLIVAVPITVPLRYIVAALSNPNQILIFDETPENDLPVNSLPESVDEELIDVITPSITSMDNEINFQSIPRPINKKKSTILPVIAGLFTILSLK